MCEQRPCVENAGTCGGHEVPATRLALACDWSLIPQLRGGWLSRTTGHLQPLFVGHKLAG
jgi:hypothetical protein